MIKSEYLAFPQLHSIDGNWQKLPDPEFRGMSLRDYFAAKAMQALIEIHSRSASQDVDGNIICSTSYELADAMLKARESK